MVQRPTEMFGRGDHHDRARNNGGSYDHDHHHDDSDSSLHDDDNSDFDTDCPCCCNDNDDFECCCGKRSCSVFGILLWIGSMYLIFWNEQRGVLRRRELEEGFKMVTTVRLEDFQDGLLMLQDGDLVHVTGRLSTTPLVLKDEEFGVVAGNDGDAMGLVGSSDDNSTDVLSNRTDTVISNSTQPQNLAALRLLRRVMMYQWIESWESRDTTNWKGETTTKYTYYYYEEWSKFHHNSSEYDDKNKRNPDPPFRSREWKASKVMLGNEFELSTKVLNNMRWYEQVDDLEIEKIPDKDLRERISHQESSNDTFYYRATEDSSPSRPKVGDMILWWQLVEIDIISIVARIEGNQLTTFPARMGNRNVLIQKGNHTKQEMLEQAMEETAQNAIALRLVGILMLFLSVGVLLKPYSAAMTTFPVIDKCIRGTPPSCIFPCTAITITVAMASIAVSLAWLTYRPAIAAPILVCSTLIIGFMLFSVRPTKNADGPTAAVP
eukprot:CAMPEP_0176005814 /NCGR_PEP_ID=MMETSP0120_2-20121206/2400_1 /TAXON_ID=160619 /ORGANISM="Kryptoperidinium foliaceum, Strain CCMP 1326" /LENGTH=491 /DNA_ID=CAMNT_0017338533 /DNA_START=73 /DNA_END=1544 /DNA_ORIENTATION=+